MRSAENKSKLICRKFVKNLLMFFLPIILQHGYAGRSLENFQASFAPVQIQHLEFLSVWTEAQIAKYLLEKNTSYILFLNLCPIY